MKPRDFLKSHEELFSEVIPRHSVPIAPASLAFPTGGRFPQDFRGCLRSSGFSCLALKLFAFSVTAWVSPWPIWPRLVEGTPLTFLLFFLNGGTSGVPQFQGTRLYIFKGGSPRKTAHFFDSPNLREPLFGSITHREASGKPPPFWAAVARARPGAALSDV